MNDDLERALRDVLAKGLSVRLRLADEDGAPMLALRLRLDAGETAWSIPVEDGHGLETALGEALRIGLKQVVDGAEAAGPAGGGGEAIPRSRPLPAGGSFVVGQ